jgi:DNA-binding CsgD family transcriptional regulator
MTARAQLALALAGMTPAEIADKLGLGSLIQW